MKKSILFLILLFSVLTIVSCNNDLYKSSFKKLNFNISDYIDLCDYKNIVADKNYCRVYQKDIEAAVNADLSYNECFKPTNKTRVEKDDIVLLLTTNTENNDSEEKYYIAGSEDFGAGFDNELIGMSVGDKLIGVKLYNMSLDFMIMGIYEEATYNDTEFVLNYYKLNTIDEVKDMLKERIKTEIEYNYMLDYIIENSSFISSPIKSKNENYDFWVEFLILQALLEKENASITETEFKNEIALTASVNNCDEKYVLSNIAESVMFSVMDKKLKTILPSYIIIK